MFKSIKLPIVVLVLSLVITFFGFSGSSATLSLNQSLQNQLAAVTTTLPKVITTKPVVPPYQFARTLKLGSTGPDVKTLQIYLNQDPTTIVATKGLGSPNNETTYYGPATSKAVSKFQLKYKSDILTPNHLTSPTGQFGPATLKKLNSLLALSTTSLLTTTLTTTTPSTTPVSTFSRTLKLGSTGSDVKQLQIFLNSDPTTRIALSGPGSPGQETTYYGSLTSKAVSLFQQKYQVTAANGVIDTPTLQKLNSIITTLNTSNTTSSAGGSTVVTTGGGGSGGPSGGGSSAVTTSGGGGGGSGGGGGTMPPAGGGGGGGGGTSPPVVPNPPTPPTPPAPPGAIITPGSGFTSATPQPPNQGSSSQFGYNDNAIARWDVVPYQTFSGTFNVGVVAFHNSGIDHVAFSVNNGPWTNISQMALNQQTGNMTGIGNPSPGTTEYWATLQSSSFPTDGQIEVRAIAYPTTGVPRVLPSLYLNSNNNRTLNERYVYVSPTGNDSMADGTQEHPYQTLLAAATYNTGGHGHKTSADNLTIYLEEGDYSWPAAVWNENPSNSTGWLTVASAPGTNPFHVRITSVVNGSSGFNTPLIHLNNLTVGDGVKGTTLVGNQGVSTQSLWIDTVNLAGPGIKVNLNGVVVNGFGNSYWTNVYMHDHSGHINGTLIRNTAVTNAAVAYQNAGIMINSTASNIYVPKGTTYHNDILQYYQTNSGWGNDIVYGLTATDHVPSQGLTLGPAPVLDFAAVNLDLENYGNGESIFQAQGQTITNLYIKNSTFIGSASWNRIVPPGFSAHDIVFDGVTFSQASMYKPVDGVSFVNTPPAITSPVMNTVTSMTSSGGHIMPYGVAALANRASQQYTITADSGYTVDQVLVDGQPVSLTNGTYTFNNVTADHNIIASFTSVATAAYTLTVTATNGSITVNPNQSTYTIGTQVTLTATPTSGYQFGSWSGGVGGTNNPLTITMNSDETITANFVQAPSSPANLTAGLIAYYPLDGNVNDLSGNNYNGTLVGTSTYITGKFGQALQITDYTNYVGLNKLPQTLGTVHSFAFWAKTNSDTLTDCIFINANSMANAVRLVGDNLTYGVSDASASVPTGTIANGWHHFAIVRNDTSVTFYKDGTLLGTAQTLATDSVFNTTYGYGRIGGAQYQHPNGAVDDFRIYNRALSAGDVATLYNGTLSYHEVTPSLATTQNPSFLASVFLSVQNVFNAVDDYIFAR